MLSFSQSRTPAKPFYFFSQLTCLFSHPGESLDQSEGGYWELRQRSPTLQMGLLTISASSEQLWFMPFQENP